MIIKKDLPNAVKELTNELQSFIKSLDASCKAKQFTSLEEYCISKLNESKEEKRKQLETIYKQIKSILKKVIFDFVDSVVSTHTLAVRHAFGENNPSFKEFQVVMNRFEEKLLEVKQKKDDKNQNYIETFLDLYTLKESKQSLKEADQVIRSIGKECCNLPFEVDWKLNKISDLIEFSNFEPDEDALTKYSGQAYRLMNSQTPRSPKRARKLDLDLLHKSDSEEEFDIMMDLKGHQMTARANTKKHDFIVQSQNSAPFKAQLRSNLEIDISDVEHRRLNSVKLSDFDRQNSKGLMTPFGRRRINTTSVFASTSVNEAQEFVVPLMSSRNMSSSSSSNMYQTVASNFMSQIQNPTIIEEKDSTDTKPREYNQSDRYSKSKGLSTSLYKISAETAFIENHSITQVRIKDALKKIFENQPKVTRIVFKKNMFLTDPIAVLSTLITSPLSAKLTIEFVNNQFAKGKSPNKDTSDELAAFNVQIKIN